MLMVALCAAMILIFVKIFDRIKSDLLEGTLKQAILIGSGVFVIVFFLGFDRFYNKFEAFVAIEIIGGMGALVIGGIAYFLLQPGNRALRLAAKAPGISIIGTLIIGVLFGVSFLLTGSTKEIGGSRAGSSKSNRPNIMLIVLDTVRADHLSLYGYNLRTTPFLEKMAEESAVFDNAFSTAPWTLPSHASLFTGLYPSQHNTHGEHFWLDDSFRTLAERLKENDYQTISFSNNDYVSSYHNLVQGFERCWYKTRWTDDPRTLAPNLGNNVHSFFRWCWNRIQTYVLAKIIQNPSSLFDYPTAAVTNEAISKWLNHERDIRKPFFIFINYMDAHFPYNPNYETARLFLNEEDIAASYKQKLRNPQIEYLLDLSKGGYTEKDIYIIKALYDACIRYLDGELENLMKTLKRMRIYDDTMIIITSDHGEYLGTRNRLGHGLGLHDELLHVPLLVRYPNLFDAGARYDTIVNLIDIPTTILSFIGDLENKMNFTRTQVLFDLKDDFRPDIFGEVRFPMHLMVNASLLEDNSGLFVEQKCIHNRNYELIWKSRGAHEFYNVFEDPSQVNNLYSKDNEKAEAMKKQLLHWFESLYIPKVVPRAIGISGNEEHKLLERLRGIGYIK